jgi:hypothetical protein
MFHNDLQSEAAFYGKQLEVIGHMYVRPAKMKAAYPDVLFFCLYTTRLLVDKKLLLTTAKEIQKNLAMGPRWEKVVRWDEDREFTLPVRVIEYKGLVRSAFSASMMLGKTVHYRFGHIGFGFFSNGKQFGKCAEASVYAMLETIYNKNEDDPQCLDYLWQAAAAISKLELGKELTKGDCLKIAQGMYAEITQDYFPGLCATPKQPASPHG